MKLWTQPFHWSTWLCIFGMILVSGMFMWFVEADVNEIDYPEKTSHVLSGLNLSLWMGLMHFSGAGGHTPITPAGRWHMAVFSFLILILVACYTANLASFFTITPTTTVRVCMRVSLGCDVVVGCMYPLQSMLAWILRLCAPVYGILVVAGGVQDSD